VFDTLHTVWGKSSWWTHCKVYEKTKNGRQAFRTLHAQLLSGNKVVTSGSTIMTKIQNLRYDGDKARFGFDKYVQLHVEQHNLHKDLEEYGVDPLSEELKILWFEQGIKTSGLDVVKASVLANKANYQTFQSVQDAYVDYYRKIAATDPLKARQVSSVRAGHRSSTPRRSSGGKGGSGQGGGQGSARAKGVFSQAELDACKIVNRQYSKAEYKAMTPIEKMKLWQLRNPDKTPGQGPTRVTSDKASVASTSTASTGKRSREDDVDVPMDEPEEQGSPGWGRNRGNPGVSGRQRKTDN
jgi:hypothetical protein